MQLPDMQVFTPQAGRSQRFNANHTNRIITIKPILFQFMIISPLWRPFVLSV